MKASLSKTLLIIAVIFFIGISEYRRSKVHELETELAIERIHLEICENDVHRWTDRAMDRDHRLCPENTGIDLSPDNSGLDPDYNHLDPYLQP